MLSQVYDDRTFGARGTDCEMLTLHIEVCGWEGCQYKEERYATAEWKRS